MQTREDCELNVGFTPLVQAGLLAPASPYSMSLTLHDRPISCSFAVMLRFHEIKSRRHLWTWTRTQTHPAPLPGKVLGPELGVARSDLKPQGPPSTTPRLPSTAPWPDLSSYFTQRLICQLSLGTHIRKTLTSLVPKSLQHLISQPERNFLSDNRAKFGNWDKLGKSTWCGFSLVASYAQMFCVRACHVR